MTLLTRENYYKRRPSPVQEHFVTIQPHWADQRIRLPLLIANELEFFTDESTPWSNTSLVPCWACGGKHRHGLAGEFVMAQPVPFKLVRPIYDFRYSHCRKLEEQGYESYALLFDPSYVKVVDPRPRTRDRR